MIFEIYTPHHPWGRRFTFVHSDQGVMAGDISKKNMGMEAIHRASERIWSTNFKIQLMNQAIYSDRKHDLT